MDRFSQTEKMASHDFGLPPEVARELELAISRRLNPQKAILESMKMIREYAIREGLTNDLLSGMEADTDKPVSL